MRPINQTNPRQRISDLMDACREELKAGLPDWRKVRWLVAQMLVAALRGGGWPSNASSPTPEPPEEETPPTA